MKRTLFLLALLLGIAILGDTLAPYRAVTTEQQLVRGTGAEETRTPTGERQLLDTVRGERLRVDIAARGRVFGGHVDFTARGGTLFARVGGRESAIPLGPGYQRCGLADATGAWRCRIAFRYQDAGRIELAAADAPAEVRLVRVAILKSSNAAAVGIDSLLVFLGALSIAGALLLAVRVPVAAKATLLAVAGAAWLVVSGGAGGVAMLLMLAGTGWLLWRQLSVPGARDRIVLTIVAVIAMFLFVRLLAAHGLDAFANPGGIALGVPLGFAFFAIRALDLSFRIAMREIRELSPREYLAYMLFPATLAAGPIFTLPQFRAAAIERPGIVDWTAGLARMAMGLAKKVAGDLLFARAIGPGLSSLYQDPLGMPGLDLWGLLLANALYVYLDFSAYSDIAIGIGRQLGWRVPENFEFPFFAPSMRAFWQRWHITLSAWVVRWVHFYTAFSLRRSARAFQATLPALASLIIIGLWHEVQVTYLLWGVHHSAGILLGDAVGAAFALLAASRAAPLLAVVRHAAGMAFVWAWVALSHCFTLLSDPGIALAVYGSALGFSR